MCGFLGALSFKGSIDDCVEPLQAGLSAIRHRGPDSSQFVANGNVYLGHNRLSIIDLSDAANQPFKSATAGAWIIYNGEIYNFDELRKSLETRTRFVTRSDTEVLLEGYLADGLEFFKKVRGIYAFAILDRRSRPKFILGRDPAGVKPLYYARTKDVFVFGSEIKALRPVLHDHLTIDHDVIKAYLNLGYCPEPFTAYREVRALSPGHALIVSEDQWQDVSLVSHVFTEQNRLTFQENVERVSSLLAKAVERNLVADVETAVALSGGIDSSLVYAHATRANANIRALTVRFDDQEYDEAGVAELYGRHLSGRQLTLSVDADFCLERLNQLLLHFDQPFADSSAVPVYYLTKATRQHTKVLLGGDGGDELFNGYASLASLPYVYRARQLGCAPVLGGLLAIARQFSDGERARTLTRAGALLSGEPTAMLFDWLSWFPRHTRLEQRSPFLYPPDAGLALYREAFKDSEPASFTGRLVFEHFTKLLLSDYLRKTDMMSMLNGVEYRVPLLDEDLVQFALSIPFGQKSSLRQHKKFLRYLHEQLFPAETSRAPKRGFSIPLDVYLAPTDLAKMRDLVLRRDSFVRAYVRDDYLGFVFDVATGAREGSRYLSRAGTYQRVLLFYSLELWRQHDTMGYSPTSRVEARRVEALNRDWGPDGYPASSLGALTTVH